jgi:hypothetical protein
MEDIRRVDDCGGSDRTSRRESDRKGHGNVEPASPYGRIVAGDKRRIVARIDQLARQNGVEAPRVPDGLILRLPQASALDVERSFAAVGLQNPALSGPCGVRYRHAPRRGALMTTPRPDLVDMNGALRRVAGWPALERPADPLGLEREGFGDVLEREWPAHVVRGEPLGRFSEQASATCAHVVPVSSKVDASAFWQVHAIVTRMRTTAGRRC